MILLIVEIILVLVLLPGCFCGEEVVYSATGDKILELTTQVDEHKEYCSERMVLTPGVYRIKVQSKLADGQHIFVEMKCDNSHFRALRGNGVNISAGNDYEEFQVYVVDKISTAYVQCYLYGADADALVQLDICSTGLGNRMLLFIAVLVFVAVDFLIYFRKSILEGKVSSKQQVVFWTLIAGVLVAYFPHLTDYFSFGEETAVHLQRIAYLSDSIQQGDAFRCTMQGTWLFDQGYAISLFYSDLFLHIPAFLMVIGFPVMTAYKMFVFITMVITAVIAYLGFKQCVKDEYAALFGSLIYMLSSHYISTVYSKAAVGELLAMAFLPLVCCGSYLLYTQDVSSADYKKYKWYIILGVTAVLQSHLGSAIMSMAFIVLVAVVFWKKTMQRQTVNQLLKTAGIVLLINAWFWLPLLYMLCSGISGDLNQVIWQQVRTGVTLCVRTILFLLAVFLFRKVRTAKEILFKIAGGVATVMLIASAIYRVNRIAFESAPVYLYAIESMGTVSVEYGEFILVENMLAALYYCKIAGGVAALICLVTILSMHLYQKRKREQNEN